MLLCHLSVLPLGQHVMCGCSGCMPRKNVPRNVHWKWKRKCEPCICTSTHWKNYHQGFLHHHPHPMMTISFLVNRPQSACANDASLTTVHHKTKKKSTPKIEKAMTNCKNKQLYEYLQTVSKFSQSGSTGADWSPLCAVIFVLLLIYIFRRIQLYYDSSRAPRCGRDTDFDGQ